MAGVSASPLSPRRDVPLAPFSTLGVGGAAAWFVEAQTPEDVAAAHRWAQERDLPLLVLGGGSNLVIADTGVPGLVLRIALRGRTQVPEGGAVRLRAAAGESWDAVVGEAVASGLAGIECLSGIPGTVGGTPIQNVGAYGQEVSASIVDLELFDRASGTFARLQGDECGFGYRMSRFKREDAGRFIVCAATFRLQHAAPAIRYADVDAALRSAGVTAPTVTDVRTAVLAVRRKKGMVLDPADPDSRSVGSFFMNPVVSAAEHEAVSAQAGERAPGFLTEDGGIKMPAAWLIERAGFAKGHVDGAVGVSSKHPLAIVNRGGASAADVIRLASDVKRRVHERFSVVLRPEPIFVGFEGNAAVDYLRRTPDVHSPD
jgi:UDP-N-acetylmuramate dehydrogenase